LFVNVNSKIGDIISSSFNSSLRNAFSHSEYYFNKYSKEIILTNYKGKSSFEIERLGFDDWTLRFCNSFLLAYHLQNLLYNERKKLIHMKPYDVILLDINGTKTNGCILYDNEKDSFICRLK